MKGLSTVFVIFFFLGMSSVCTAQEESSPFLIQDGPFNREMVISYARNLARKPYQPIEQTIPDAIKNMDYDTYRNIAFSPKQAIWAKTDLPYQMQFFLLGHIFKNPIEVGIVEKNRVHTVHYHPEMFVNRNNPDQSLPKEEVGFSGFRLHNPMNRPDYFDEVVVFQGASYFRSLGKKQNYGLSARGLAVRTGDPKGEEFPVFRSFWIEKPTTKSNSIVVHALLDSPSVAGAYRFTIRPGDNTIMDVEATLFPRTDMDKVGLSPLTSMYMFSMNGRVADDFRPEVHDSDGLLMETGKGERLWRPLANPQTLQICVFADSAPVGFGLMQRERNFSSYEDLEAAYENRPGLWVAPVGNWGDGNVILVEIPSQSEIHDNIVAFWKPRELFKAGSEYSFSYRLSWGNESITDIARVVATRMGRADVKHPTPDRLFVVDYTDPDFDETILPDAQVLASAGKISNVVVQKNPHVHGYRVSFHLQPDGVALSELRLELKFEDNRKAETWLYRWTSKS
ncbi:glucan biosynthesis protein [Desulfogranum japonicum]|uniref:glucan biosynthesis protein n=1 Tax=Desulfogranum japonicum TaxID=231447 RepID=UPI000427107E|nr:glucan biosynthesis protein G [Desulfogranum japonicum]